MICIVSVKAAEGFYNLYYYVMIGESKVIIKWPLASQLADSRMLRLVTEQWSTLCVGVE